MIRLQIAMFAKIILNLKKFILIMKFNKFALKILNVKIMNLFKAMIRMKVVRNVI